MIPTHNWRLGMPCVILSRNCNWIPCMQPLKRSTHRSIGALHRHILYPLAYITVAKNCNFVLQRSSQASRNFFNLTNSHSLTGTRCGFKR